MREQLFGRPSAFHAYDFGSSPQNPNWLRYSGVRFVFSYMRTQYAYDVKPIHAPRTLRKLSVEGVASGCSISKEP